MNNNAKRIAMIRIQQLKPWQNIDWIQKLYPSNSAKFHRETFWPSSTRGTYKKRMKNGKRI